MSDIKSLILPFFLRHYLFLCLRYYLFFCSRLCLCYSLFSLSPLFPFSVFVSVFVIAFFLCLRYSLFSVFVSVFVIAFFLCLRYCLFSVFVIAQPIIRLFKMQKSIIKKTKNKVFAQRDKCYMGWFFILIFHLICNENGEMLNFYSGKLVDMPRK